MYHLVSSVLSDANGGIPNLNVVFVVGRVERNMAILRLSGGGGFSLLSDDVISKHPLLLLLSDIYVEKK